MQCARSSYELPSSTATDVPTSRFRVEICGLRIFYWVFFAAHFLLRIFYGVFYWAVA